MSDPLADPVDLDALAARLRAGRDALLALQPVVEAGAPWPFSSAFGVEPESSWGPPETLAHVAEMVPFWTGEIERVLAGASEPVPFGRVAANELRIGVIERDRSLPARELFDRVDSGVERLARRLAGLSSADAARLGVHPTLGEMTVATIASRFVAGHLEEHIAQLRDVTAAG